MDAACKAQEQLPMFCVSAGICEDAILYKVTTDGNFQNHIVFALLSFSAIMWIGKADQFTGTKIVSPAWISSGCISLISQISFTVVRTSLLSSQYSEAMDQSVSF